ncbi:MAG: crotonobetainyl-CoA--carnitine CoA-transferase [Candidatus Omnitrophica bacterium]|nr:crotonobetainyl-CoA--carnitine CoA-transferase [Candidatus Omnitrophota bacterium]
MKFGKHNAIVLSSPKEKELFAELVRQLKKTPIPDNEILDNIGLFLTSKELSRLLFFYEIYQKILKTHGVIVEFGVRWGQTLSLMSALRGVFEPFNRHRKIVGFDTFSGFTGISKKDGDKCNCSDGSFSVSRDYEKYLDTILSLQERLNPMSHIKRYELVKGDALKTIPSYFKKHTETIISLAIFDFDIYKPTKVALKTIKPHMAKGSILVFDELCDDIFPGETIALREVFGLNNVRINRFPMTSRMSYVEMK